jgi:hypothetical protein
MKIGILTYHRSHNYGAVLQAYALKTYIYSLGHDVEFVDYWPEYHKDMYALWSWNKFVRSGIKGKTKMLLLLIFTRSKRKKRSELFQNFIDSYITPKTAINAINEPYDLLVYGSDQIWRCQKHVGYRGYNEVYFGGKLIPAKRRIAFSASMGIVNQDKETVTFLKRVLTNFDALSVRESDLLNLVQPLTDLKTHLTLDPVFLQDAAYWKKLAGERRIPYKYILLYNLQGNKTTAEIADALSMKTGLHVVILDGKVLLVKKNNKMYVTGPAEFISLIMHAETIVSSSFHGIAFSVIFEKEFYTNLNRNAERVKLLLRMMNLDERFVENISDLENIEPIDYRGVKKLLDVLVKSSKDYLESEIKILQS